MSARRLLLAADVLSEGALRHRDDVAAQPLHGLANPLTHNLWRHNQKARNAAVVGMERHPKLAVLGIKRFKFKDWQRRARNLPRALFLAHVRFPQVVSPPREQSDIAIAFCSLRYGNSSTSPHLRQPASAKRHRGAA